MKKTFAVLLCVGLLGAVVPFGVFADYDDFEIIDEENDVYVIFLSLFFNRFLGHIDIVSGSFYEKLEDPDILYITLKVRDFSYKHLVAIYAVHWDFNGTHYACGIHTFLEGETTPGILQVGNSPGFEIVDFSIDESDNSITWVIPKILIGDPQPGDVLVETFGWTGLRFVNNDYNDLLVKYFDTGEIAKDSAFGDDYSILY
jgi:hypothetical protein